MSEIVNVSCIRHIYPDKTEVNICGLDFVVNRGERIVILGHNGSGKTTLLSHILGLLKPVEGMVSVFGLSPFKDFKKIRRRMGVVFQNVDEQIVGPTVYDDIAFSLRNEGQPPEEVKRQVKEIGELLNINHIMNKIPHYLSGGQKKKVALAGALVLSPELLIMDEPFDGLDPRSKKEIIDIINKLNTCKGVTTIITTHDINIVPYVADVIYILDNGTIVRSGRPEEIFQETEILCKANLEPPILVQLFRKLKDKGFDVGIPVNIEQAEIELNTLIEKNRGAQILDSIYSDLKSFENNKIVIRGFVFREKGFKKENFVIARSAISCCAADASVVGFLCEFSDAGSLQNDEWIEVKGLLKEMTYDGENIPVIVVEEFKKVEKPRSEYT